MPRFEHNPIKDNAPLNLSLSLFDVDRVNASIRAVTDGIWRAVLIDTYRVRTDCKRTETGLYRRQVGM